MRKQRLLLAALAAVLGAYVGYLTISKADCRNNGGVLVMGIMEFACVAPATSLNRQKRQQRTMEALFNHVVNYQQRIAL